MDAIGGSTAGVVVDNHIQVASLFRAVPPERYAEAQGMFLRLGKEWKIPVEVANDGDEAVMGGAKGVDASVCGGGHAPATAHLTLVVPHDADIGCRVAAAR